MDAVVCLSSQCTLMRLNLVTHIGVNYQIAYFPAVSRDFHASLRRIAIFIVLLTHRELLRSRGRKHILSKFRSIDFRSRMRSASSMRTLSSLVLNTVTWCRLVAANWFSTHMGSRKNSIESRREQCQVTISPAFEHDTDAPEGIFGIHTR